MAPWWGQWKAPWWGWIFQWRCRCPEDMRFLMVWGNVWRVVRTEYVQRIMVGIFRGKSRLAEVSPDTSDYLHISDYLCLPPHLRLPPTTSTIMVRDCHG